MKDLNYALAKKFFETCESIKNAQNSDDLNFYVGVASGIASGLLLSNVIDIDCHEAMHHYIAVVRDKCNLCKEGDN